MKIRNKLLILCVAVAVCCAVLAFVGCDVEENYGEWVTLTLPTCESAGIQVRTSIDNPEIKQTREIPATGHEWGEWTVETEPSCSVAGTEYRVCSHCDNVDKRQIPATGHNWGDWSVLVAPTCVTDGSQKRVCLNDETHTQLQSVPATGHDFSDWVVTLAPTCEDNGVETRYCRNDNTHVEMRSIEALGHKWGEPAVITAPTCSRIGVEMSVCENDCEHIKRKNLPSIGHDWGEWVTSKVATEAEEGEEIRVCKNDCTHVERRSTPVKIGDYLAFTVIEGGYKVRRATIDTPSTVYIPATYEGKPVLEIATNGFMNCDRMEHIVFLGNNLRIVNNMVFAKCVNLQSVEFPEGVTTLGSHLFYDCPNLKSIVIPSTVTKIGSIRNGNKGVQNIETITVHPDNRVYKSDGNCLIERATDTLLMGTNNAQIPEYVTTIASRAFYKASIESIVIPASVRNIEAFAFEHCDNLHTVTFLSKSITFQRYAFVNCGNLTRIEIPQGVGEFPMEALTGCGDVQIVVIPDQE